MNNALRLPAPGRMNYIYRFLIILLVIILLVSISPIRARAFVIADDVGAAALVAYLASIMGITFDSTGDMQDAVTGFMNWYGDRSDIENILLSQSGDGWIFGPAVAVAVANVMGWIRDWFGYDETLPGEVYIPQTGYAVMVYSDGVVYADGVPIMDSFDSTKCKLIHFTSINQTVYPCDSLALGLRKVTPEDSYYKGQVQSLINNALTWDIGDVTTWDDPLNTDTYVWFNRRQNTIDMNIRLKGNYSGKTYDLKTLYPDWVNDVINRLDSAIYDLPSSSLPYGTTGIDASEPFLEKIGAGDVPIELGGVIEGVQDEDRDNALPYTQGGLLENAGVDAGTQTGDTTVDQLDLEGLESSGLGALFISKFPFSIPWDLAKAVGLLAAPAVTPYWEIDLYAPIAHRVGGWAGDTTIEIDFSQFEILGQLSRWVSTILFVFALAAGTKRFIWTA